MKELFKANDKYLKIINIVVLVLCIVMAALLFLCAIIFLAVMDSEEKLYALIPLFCELFVAVSYLIWKIVYFYLMDVKFIRNKLYGADELNRELSGKSETNNGYEGSEGKTSDRYERLQKVNEALKMGAITQEEFEEEKKKII